MYIVERLKTEVLEVELNLELRISLFSALVFELTSWVPSVAVCRLRCFLVRVLFLALLVSSSGK